MQSNIKNSWFILFSLILSSMIISFSSAAFAKGDVFVNGKGIAIKGYDPVAYFVSAKALKGKKEFSHKHAGNTWQFANAANKNAFIANPMAYIPQYGGHCAYAASKNSIAPVDPKSWAIREGKLYLNYSSRIHKKWLPNIEANIKKGDANWPALATEVAKDDF